MVLNNMTATTEYDDPECEYEYKGKSNSTNNDKTTSTTETKSHRFIRIDQEDDTNDVSKSIILCIMCFSL